MNEEPKGMLMETTITYLNALREFQSFPGNNEKIKKNLTEVTGSSGNRVTLNRKHNTAIFEDQRRVLKRADLVNLKVIFQHPHRRIHRDLGKNELRTALPDTNPNAKQLRHCYAKNLLEVWGGGEHKNIRFPSF